MPDPSLVAGFSPLQLAIYETDLLGVNLRDSMRIVSLRMGFFIGQERYLKERAKIAALLPASDEARAS
jgi:hypothetical protein